MFLDRNIILNYLFSYIGFIFQQPTMLKDIAEVAAKTDQVLFTKDGKIGFNLRPASTL
jgi:hypothetical protein